MVRVHALEKLLAAAQRYKLHTIAYYLARRNATYDEQAKLDIANNTEKALFAMLTELEANPK
jgi:hypothetical protein